MAAILWLIVCLIFLGLELVFCSPTSVWFAAGALAGFLSAAFGRTAEVQLAVFVLVSFTVLILIRPLAFAAERRRRAGGYY